MKIKFLEHTADVKFQAFGGSLEAAFANAALALKQVITKESKVKQVITRKVQVSGKDNEALLYNFLEEFLFLLDAKDFILSKIKKIEIEKDKLTAEVLGDKASLYKFNNDVKAVTYNQMYVKKYRNGYIVQVVLDV